MVYVQNIGDSQVTLQTGQSIYVGGILDSTATINPTVLSQGATATISTSTSVQNGGTYVVKVVSSDGTFTKATKTFP